MLDSSSALAVIVTYVAILTILPRKARRHGAVIVRSAATFVAAIVVVAALFLHSFPRWVVRDTDMKRWIAAELPRGSSEAAVRAFLHRHSVPGETVDRFTDNQGVVIYAEVEPNFSDLVCGGDPRMAFYLGRSDRLNNHAVEERLVCL